MAERVLIIDDDARLAAMVSDYLVAAGFAPATSSLAFACALIVGGAVVAARKSAA